MDNNAMFHLTYGLYLLTTRSGGKDEGSIINTVMQVANDPERIAVAAKKTSQTQEVLRQTGQFAISAITDSATFELFQRFGMQSGRDTDKFRGFDHIKRTPEGLVYLNKDCSAWLSGRVVQTFDLGTHSLFIAELTDGQVLNNDAPCTYAYYQDHIKPKPQPKTAAPRWECSVCGWVYEGEEVPDDFLCPLCKHGKEDFVRLS